MGAKWKIVSSPVVVDGSRQWVWRAISPSSSLFSQIFIDEFLFRDQPAALIYVLDQIETTALAEATA
jgi:hypothetical protein